MSLINRLYLHCHYLACRPVYLLHAVAKCIVGPPDSYTAPFIFLYFNNNITKICRLSGIRTWIVALEGEHTDHLNTATMAYSPTTSLVVVGSVTKLDALLDFRQLFKPLGNNFFHIPTQFLCRCQNLYFF